ncbi:MAG: hypothetical protein K0Q50_1690 [Vampirovibrio sp.]|nr:hypothetical protein [Vampirovibrio sp.]
MNNRWYDRDPACPRLIKQIQGMQQPELREFCARTLINFCEKLRKEIQLKDRKNRGINSIGLTALTGLYRFGQRRRRWYDQEPALHKAVGMLYSLPEIGLSVIAYKLGDTFGLLQIYSIVCSQVDQPPNMKDIAKITTTALKTGKEEAESILVSLIGSDLYRALSPKVND